VPTASSMMTRTLDTLNTNVFLYLLPKTQPAHQLLVNNTQQITNKSDTDMLFHGRADPEKKRWVKPRDGNIVQKITGNEVYKRQAKRESSRPLRKSYAGNQLPEAPEPPPAVRSSHGSVVSNARSRIADDYRPPISSRAPSVAGSTHNTSRNRGSRRSEESQSRASSRHTEGSEYPTPSSLAGRNQAPRSRASRASRIPDPHVSDWTSNVPIGRPPASPSYIFSTHSSSNVYPPNRSHHSDIASEVSSRSRR
jgi:hypothetical protein